LRVKNKLSFTKVLEALGVARGSLHSYLSRLSNTSMREFYEIMQGVNRLKAVGIIREDRGIDYSPVLRAIALAT